MRFVGVMLAASAILETCLAHAEGVLAKAALREVLRDEIDHGCIGWAHPASHRRRDEVRGGPWLLRIPSADDVLFG